MNCDSASEQLAEKVRQVIWLAEDEHAVEANQCLDSLLARLAEAERLQAMERRATAEVRNRLIAAEDDRDRCRAALGQLWADRESWYDAMGDDEAGLPSEYQEHVWGIVGDALDPEQKP